MPNLYLGEWPRLPFTARIGRAQFQRARSSSKKGTWPLPSDPSKAARCARTEDHQPPSPSLLSYSIPVILLADSTVLSSSIAIVIGPTPPGTGLIQPAF